MEAACLDPFRRQCESGAWVSGADLCGRIILACRGGVVMRQEGNPPFHNGTVKGWATRGEGTLKRLADDVEGAVPAGLVEDVQEDVAHEGDAVADRLLVDLVGGRLEGPVDVHGAADDIFAGDESPEAAVERLGAVVAHGEDGARGYDKFAVDDVVGQVVGP